jgi:hypothetical protein
MDRDIDERVLGLLKRLPGVARVELLTPEIRSHLPELATPAAAENQGMQAVLSRHRSVCLFKGRSFRGPAEPSLLMVDEEGAVLGRELTGPDDLPLKNERRTVHLGRDFVLVRGVRPQGHVRFVLPPVRFPELEEVPIIRRAVSASPDPPQDEWLRKQFGMRGGKDLASILVGYDWAERNPGGPSTP